jgi:glucuronokinase
VIYPWEQLEIVFSQQDKNRFGSLAELCDDVRLNGYYGGVRLVKAATKKFAELANECGWPTDREPFSIRYESNIPRGVGLAGSSAIVVATLKCLAAYYEAPIADDLMASLARSVEQDELKIACGYQDRVAQVYQGLTYMDFAKETMRPLAGGYEAGVYERLDASLLPPLYIAYDLAASKESGVVHDKLANRMKENVDLSATMRKVAALVPQARSAIEARDARSLAAIIDQNFNYRTSLYHISPERRAMVDAARSVGASAKFAGSGGAIVGTYADEPMFERLRQAIESGSPHWRIFKPRIV